MNTERGHWKKKENQHTFLAEFEKKLGIKEVVNIMHIHSHYRNMIGLTCQVGICINMEEEGEIFFLFVSTYYLG